MRGSLLSLLLMVSLCCPAQDTAQDTAQDAAQDAHRLTLSVVDADSGQAIAARIYLTSADGTPHFFTSSSPEGTAFRYEKQNRGNQSSVEYHTTVSPHPCFTTVTTGQYELTVERGQTYLPHREAIGIGQDLRLPTIRLRRWADPAQRGWYSGDTHIHRQLSELPNVIMAEDLNVVFPLTNWVTLSGTPPSAGNKNIDIDVPDQLIKVDDQHVIWPRNTEYEIFTVNGQRHTLGALFVLGHRGALQQTVPPWQGVIDAARAADPDVLFDMDKLAWPFAMTLPVLAPDATYELANNHMWRTQFAFRDWYTPAPSFIQPPYGGTAGGESEWIDLTLGMYYTLLNCGFRLPPSAGTANGVHPVPAGFGRVYVQLADGLDYASWRRGLQQGRSFVTTGPMVFATAAGEHPGYTFDLESNESSEITLDIEVLSQEPITFGEVLINGAPRHLLRARSEKTEAGAYRSVIQQTIAPQRSGWFAVRFFEDRPGGRVRFAHTAPWYVSVDDQPVQPSRMERDYLVTRMKDEMQRSRGVVSPPAMDEYQRALDHYQSLPVAEIPQPVLDNARPLADDDRQDWLRNMIVDHRFSAQEVRMATGMPIEQAAIAVQRMSTLAADATPVNRLRIQPYPGGRHPRRGFLDGALLPQRETKISVFAPWDDGGYAVVDVPEAIFSNLGLTYLAHTHVPTIWTQQSIELDPLEWRQTEDGLQFQRTLPNRISFGSNVRQRDRSVVMDMWLTNGTDQPLTNMRSQVCVMLKGLVGFNSQRRREPVIQGPLIAIKSDRGDRWLITGWTPHHRSWANPPVPCVHSDPVFPDCAPGETVKVRGGLWFYEGNNLGAEIERIQQTLANETR